MPEHRSPRDHASVRVVGGSLLCVAAIAIAAVGCGSSTQQASNTAFAGKTPKLTATRNPDGSINDQSRCDYRNRADRESSETAGAGFIQPNVRRVWQVIGTGDDRHKVLVCREIDTNFDGIKDVVRTYNDKGESLHEEADANFDGRIDTWITFSKGRLAEVKIDSNQDGNPDEWKTYNAGQLSKIKRDSNFDGKPDIWEIYRGGVLERMGVDSDGDEQVDRWDHDNEQRRRFEDAERKKEEEAAAAAQKKAQEEREASDKANDAVDEGAKGDKK